MSCQNSCLLIRMHTVARLLSQCPSIQNMLERYTSDDALQAINVGPPLAPEDQEQYAIEERENMLAWINVFLDPGGHSGSRESSTTEHTRPIVNVGLEFYRQLRESEISDRHGRNEMWQCFADRIAKAMETELWDAAADIGSELASYSLVVPPSFERRNEKAGSGPYIAAIYNLEYGLPGTI